MCLTPSDLALLVDGASSVVELAILIVGIGRVAQIRKGFVGPTYRSRAFWSGFLMAVIAIADAASLIPVSNSVTESLIFNIPLLAIIGVSFAFVDRTAIVGIGSDFFHRDILGWMKVRIPYGVVMGGSLVYGAVAMSAPESASPSPPLWDLIGMFQVFAVSAVLLGFGAVVIIIASRRTSDRTLKKNIRLLGIAMGWFVLALAIFFVPGEAAGAVGSLLTVPATFYLYLSAMSLTPLGRTMREESN